METRRNIGCQFIVENHKEARIYTYNKVYFELFIIFTKILYVVGKH